MNYLLTTAREMLERAAVQNYISPSQLYASGGTRDVRKFRTYLIYYLREYLGLSYKEIASLIKRSMHYTYLLARTNVAAMESDIEFYDSVYKRSLDESLKVIAPDMHDAIVARKEKEKEINNSLAEAR